MLINRTGEDIECEACFEPIEDGDYFFDDDGYNLCELCYENAHEYDND